MDKVEQFLTLFSDFELIIKSKEERTFREAAEVSSTGNTKSQLKKSLKRLEKQYQAAMKAFRIGKITKNELYDFEWRIFELQEEIKKLEDSE